MQKIVVLVLSLIFECGAQYNGDYGLNQTTDCRPMEDVLLSGGCYRHQFLCHDKNRFNESLLTPSEMARDVFASTVCFCDSNCWKFKDCCVDATLPSEPAAAEDNFRWGCELLPGSYEHIYVIASCPSHWRDPKEVDLCERRVSQEEYSYVLDIPVFSNSTRRAYANMYCAKCHKDVDLAALHIKLTCPEDLANCRYFLQQSHYQFGRHKWQIHAGGLHFGEYIHLEVTEYLSWEGLKSSYNIRRCRPVVDSCSNDNQYVENCTYFYTSHVESVEFARLVYKNIHCALCNNVSLASSIRCFSGVRFIQLPYLYPYHEYEFENCTLQVPEYEAPVYFGKEYGGRHTTISLLFDFHARSGTNEVGLEFRCKAGEIFVPISDECTNFKYGIEFINAGSECLNVMNETQNKHQTHRMLRIAKEETTILRENNSIYINKTGLVFESGEYEEYDNETYMVCHPWDLYEVKFSIMQSRISQAIIVVSLICLAIHIIVYASIQKLRNLPGKNLMSLSISLFIAQSLFLFGSSSAVVYPILCTTIAIMTHFCFLASFFWMNVMAFDIYHTFAHAISQSRPTKDRYKNTFLCFSAYAWLTPSLIIITALVTDYTDILPSIRPDYGARICWLNNRQGLLFFFAIPLALLLLSNIIFFILTAYSIYQTTNIAQSVVKKKKDQLRFFLYMKLALIMGLTWVFGYISAVVESDPLQYVFIILNAGQGTLIFIAFTLKRKVISLVVESFKRKAPTAQDGCCIQKSTKCFRACIKTSSDNDIPVPSRGKLEDSSKDSSKSTETIITRC